MIVGKLYIFNGLPSLSPSLYLHSHSKSQRTPFALYLHDTEHANRFIQTTPAAPQKASHAAGLSILLSPALLIIDHIHFQYNGFLYDILVLSLVYTRRPSTMLLGGTLFAILLCFKHIYLYLAPAYFIYLLRSYCLSKHSIWRIRWLNCVQLGTSIVAVLGVAFGPFAFCGQAEQLLSRLFPFSRGLCHAYWAPNIWAMYSFTDRVLLHGKTCFSKIKGYNVNVNVSSCAKPGVTRRSKRGEQCH